MTALFWILTVAAVLPFVVYVTIKLGVVAFYRGRQQARQNTGERSDVES